MEIETIRYHQIETKAPDHPGVYAWYVVPRLGAKDYDDAEAIRGEVRRTIEANLPRQDERRRARFALWDKLTSDFSVNDERLNHLYDRTNEKRREYQPSEYKMMARHLRDRNLIAFMSPLYVGKTSSSTLRDRLLDHRSELERQRTSREAYEAAAMSHVYPDDFANILATRLRDRSVEVDRILIACLPLDVGPQGGEDAEAVAGAIDLLEKFFLSVSNPSLSED